MTTKYLKQDLKFSKNIDNEFLMGICLERAKDEPDETKREGYAILKYTRAIKQYEFEKALLSGFYSPVEFYTNYPSLMGEQLFKHYCPTLENFTFENIPLLARAKKPFQQSSGIFQYSDKKLAGKIIKGVTQLDANSAYLRHFTNKIPVGYIKTVYSFEEALACSQDLDCDNCILYEFEDGSLDFNPTYMIDIVQYHILKLGIVEGVENYKKEFYDHNLKVSKDNKSLIKQITVAGLGKISLWSPTVAYIWYKQGLEMEGFKHKLELNGHKLYKAHTDSIAFPAQAYPMFKNLVEEGKYKVEHDNETLYYVNQAMYQFENSKPTGLQSAVLLEDRYIQYQNGDLVDINTFPALKIGEKILVSKVSEKKGYYEVWEKLGDNLQVVFNKNQKEEEKKLLVSKNKKKGGEING